jgi:hypothetical protein
MLLLDTDVMVDIQRGFAPALEWLRNLPKEKQHLEKEIHQKIYKR